MTWQLSPVAVQERRRALIRRVVVVAVLLAVLAVGAVLWPRAQPGALTVPTTSTPVEPGGALQGDLVATRRGDRVCYSITTRGTTAVLRFASGWSADEGLGLLDPSGQGVAQPGDRVMLLGAPGDIGTLPGCATKGRIWTITSLRLVRAG